MRPRKFAEIGVDPPPPTYRTSSPGCRSAHAENTRCSPRLISASAIRRQYPTRFARPIVVIAASPRAAVRLAEARLTSPGAIRDRSYGAVRTRLAALRRRVAGAAYALGDSEGDGDVDADDLAAFRFGLAAAPLRLQACQRALIPLPAPGRPWSAV